MTAIYIILSLIIIGIVISIAWRRDAIPCPPWLAWMVEMDNPFTEVNRAKTIVALLGVTPGIKVLDAGCGPGRLTLPLAEAVGKQGEVIALDIESQMLERVRAKADAAGHRNITYLHAALGEGKLPRDYFDRSILVTVFGEIPDKVAALKEIYQALKPDGVLSITEVIFDPHFYQREAVLKVAEAAGFREKNFYGKKLAYTLHLVKVGD
jgi:ubiquinone/menaquinone biosynthesis C-methylase UbiE